MSNPLLRVSRSPHLRAIFGALLLSTCALAAAATLLLFLLVHFSREMGGNRDFVVYWATGVQLVHHANPYDPAALPGIEYAAGLPHHYAAGYMRNPPWALPLAWPLGLLSLRAAAVLASIVLVAALAASVRILLSLYPCPDRIVHALVWLFAPALICLILGQTSILVLLGIAVFLRFHATRPFLAGAALWLCTLKPHLLLPVAVVFVAWVVLNRQYRVVAGATAAFLLSVFVVLRLDPPAWTQYTRMLGYSGVETDPIPSLSVLLRTHLAPHFMALQFVPTALACLWALAWFCTRRRSWDWARDINLLLLVSLIAAPYAYLNDHVVVLPALVFAASRAGLREPASRPLLAALALPNALLEVAFLLHLWSPALIYWGTVFAAPVWLIWFLIATRRPSIAGAHTLAAASAHTG